jgi:hypothetical protein
MHGVEHKKVITFIHYFSPRNTVSKCVSRNVCLPAEWERPPIARNARGMRQYNCGNNTFRASMREEQPKT